MVKLLSGIAIFFVVAGIFSGIVLGLYDSDGFGWGLAITYWIGGVIAGILFFAIAIILEYVEDTNARIRNLEYELLQKNASPTAPVKIGNSKASLSKLSGFQLGKPED